MFRGPRCHHRGRSGPRVGRSGRKLLVHGPNCGGMGPLFWGATRSTRSRRQQAIPASRLIQTSSRFPRGWLSVRRFRRRTAITRPARWLLSCAAGPSRDGTDLSQFAPPVVETCGNSGQGIEWADGQATSVTPRALARGLLVRDLIFVRTRPTFLVPSNV